MSKRQGERGTAGRGDVRGDKRRTARRGDVRGDERRTAGRVDARQRDGRRRAGPDPPPLSLSCSLSRSRSLATLVTPTTSTLVQDNTRLISPLVFHLAPTHLGRDTQRQNLLVDSGTIRVRNTDNSS
jgi:hypothetical protein